MSVLISGGSAGSDRGALRGRGLYGVGALRGQTELLVISGVLQSQKGERYQEGKLKVTATKSGESGESDLDNTESTSNRGKPTIVSSAFHGAESCIPAPIAWPCP